MQESTTKNANCLIFGAGEYFHEKIPSPAHDFLIAADGGADYAHKYGLQPNITVGDFDSITNPTTDNSNSVRLPAQKDDTDMQAALKLGWDRGYRRFHIFGGLGGRIDHSIANIATLCLLANSGGLGVLHGDNTLVTVICKASLSFPAWQAPEGSMISVFAASDCAYGVCEQGLKYGLDHADLDMLMSHGSGVSNEFIDNQPSSISVEEGMLLITYPLDAPEPTWETKQPSAASLGDLEKNISSHLTSY